MKHIIYDEVRNLPENEQIYYIYGKSCEVSSLAVAKLDAVSLGLFCKMLYCVYEEEMGYPKTIAKKCGLSITKTRKILSSLKRDGFIRKATREDENGNIMYHYYEFLAEEE